ncbi:MAG: hypothetical protein GEV12_21580 [Micromonosporaceae bacterium]|nr:hypothetical protein [Micromonosporaceae bacterium]
MRGHARGLGMATVGLVALLLAGCAPPDGIDGNLTGDWPAHPEPTSWLPEVGACHSGDYRLVVPLFAYQPVDCQRQHLTETVHVGEFTGDAADRATPPPEGSAGWRAAYAECDEAAADYLGADFRHGRLWLGLTLPAVAGWEGGGRWFRCELVGYDVADPGFEARESSLAGALEATESSLRLLCFESTESEGGESIERMERVACDKPHDTEFVGTWPAPDVPYPDAEDPGAQEQVHRGCREQVAEYADVPVDGNLIFRAGTIADWMDEQDWDNGDRRFRCYLYLADAELTESLEGAGTAGLPVR